MPQRRPSVDEVLRKYGAKIEGQVRTSNVNTQEFSQSYEKFKGEMTRQYSGYEKWCHTLGNIIRLKPSKKDEDRIKKAIDGAHLDVEPWQAIGLGVMAFISLFMLGLLISVAIALVKGDFAEFPLLFHPNQP